jgi:hypothetical protein
MDDALTSRRHQSNLKKTIVKLFFLFYLRNCMFIINATFPLTVEFDACQILVETLCPNSSSKDTPFICVPSRDPQGSLVSIQSGPMWGKTLGIKDTLLPFMTILRARPGPETLVRLQFPPSRTIDSLLTDYS